MMGTHEGDDVLSQQDADPPEEMTTHSLDLKVQPCLDVNLGCGDKTWVLCSYVLRRSPWFEKTLEKDWEEPNNKKIKIEEFDTDSVDWIVNHLYTSKYDWEQLQGERTYTGLCSHVFNMGEYFMLPRLSGSAEAGFRRMLFTLIPDFQTNDPQHGGRTIELCGIIREVYGQKNPRARKTFGSTIAMVLDSIRYGIKGMWLDDLLDEIPAVAVDMVRFTLRHRNVPRRYPDSCDNCKAPRSANLGFSKVCRPTGELQCRCWHCDGQVEEMGNFGIHMSRDTL